MKNYQPIEQPSFMIDDEIIRAQRWIQERMELKALQVENEQLQHEKEENAPKVEFHDAYHSADEADLDMQSAAKALGLGMKEFYKFLRWGKVFFKNKNKNLPQERYVKDKCFKTELYTYEIVVDDETITKNGTRVFVTPKGMKRLQKYYKQKYDMFKEDCEKTKF